MRFIVELQESVESSTDIKDYFGNLGPVHAALFILPFALLLLSIAILPLVVPHLWERHRNKAIVSLLFGLPIAGFFLYRDWHTLAVTLLDYGAFISLLATLFTISGGIYIRGSFAGRPLVNTLFLLIGAVLANLIGTTGASMLLVRPLIRANEFRQRKTHIIIFFIFIVSNCGGLLTPLGDPPLFLGFLKGVSFGWTLNLWPQWLTAVGVLLAVFHLLERYQFSKEPQDVRAAPTLTLSRSMGEGTSFPSPVPQGRVRVGATPADRFGIEGGHNFVFLGLVAGLILVSGYVIYPIGGAPILGEAPGAALSKLTQMIGMALIALASYKVTAVSVRRQNTFTFGPIVEVAVLFAGIFLTMIPALLILETQGGGLGVDQPSHYFWITGILSSFLDNAPTYLTFTSLAKGALGLPGEGLRGLMLDPAGEVFLAAISCGAVFMGANTYIGNGPNFMVKAIAEESRIRMPTFIGYMAWSFLVLIPLFVLMTFIFFR